MKILIVEDEFTSRKLLQIFLSDYGQCFAAGNGLEAVEAIEQSLIENDPYDLICMDIMMPEMDGMDAVRRIRKIESDHNITGLSGSKIVMVTAKGFPEDIFAAFRIGCEGYLVKPVRKQDLCEELEKLGVCLVNKR